MKQNDVKTRKDAKTTDRELQNDSRKKSKLQPMHKEKYRKRDFDENDDDEDYQNFQEDDADADEDEDA